MSGSPNEGRVCDAIIRALERRTNYRRAEMRFPEKDGSGPPVEIALKLGEETYALEHTRLEAVAHQIRTGHQFGEIWDPIKKGLDGNLPKPGKYYLELPFDTRIGPGRAAAVQAIVQAVRQAAAQLHAEHPNRFDRNREPRGHIATRKLNVSGVPYVIVLRRRLHWQDQAKHDGRLLVARYAPADVEKQRIARMTKALQDKCPKLQRWKERDARSVLILEDDDVALSNHIVIAEAMLTSLRERSDQPDEIWLVSTIVSPWMVWQFKHDEHLIPDEMGTEIDPTPLADLTG